MMIVCMVVTIVVVVALTDCCICDQMIVCACVTYVVFVCVVPIIRTIVIIHVMILCMWWLLPGMDHNQ